MKFLDAIGLARLWAAIKNYVDGQVAQTTEITIVSVNSNLIVREVTQTEGSNTGGNTSGNEQTQP